MEWSSHMGLNESNLWAPENLYGIYSVSQVLNIMHIITNTLVCSVNALLNHQVLVLYSHQQSYQWVTTTSCLHRVQCTYYMSDILWNHFQVAVSVFLRIRSNQTTKILHIFPMLYVKFNIINFIPINVML